MVGDGDRKLDETKEKKRRKEGTHSGLMAATPLRFSVLFGGAELGLSKLEDSIFALLAGGSSNSAGVPVFSPLPSVIPSFF
jgi:hypothetical protein